MVPPTPATEARAGDVPPGLAPRIARNGTGIARIRRLWRLFRNEVAEPEPFYSALAAEAALDLHRRHGLTGARVLDAGCGPGWYVEALRLAGAEVVGIDGDEATLRDRAAPLPGLARADAGRLPFADGTFDGVLCSNLLEHAADTQAVIDDIARVLVPGGWGYVSWTNWWSPWGGHEMTPYHLLGTRLGPRLYERRHGPPRKNRFGEGLFPVHVGSTIARFEAHPSLRVDRTEPRYWPRLSFITDIPIVREVLTWNCVIRFTKR